MTLYGFACAGTAGRDGPVPAVRRRPRRHLDRRGRGASCCWSGPSRRPGRAPLLLGVGASSDAHHMSSPHPEGLGAVGRWRRRWHRPAWRRAESTTSTCTAPAPAPTTPRRTGRVRVPVRRPVPCSSTKGWTGHTLGASGALEAIIAALVHRARAGARLPRTSTTADPAFRSDIAIAEPVAQPVRRVLSNSFGFGGSNCSLVLGRGAVSGAPVGGDRGCSAPASPGWARAGACSPAPRLTGCAAAAAGAARCPATGRAPRGPRLTIRLAMAAARPGCAARLRRAPSAGQGVRQRQWRWRGDRCIWRMLASRGTRSRRPNSTTRCTTRPAGYWSIAAGSDGALDQPRLPGRQFAAALLQAAAKVERRRRARAALRLRLPFPPPLASGARRPAAPFATRHGADAAAGAPPSWPRLASRYVTGQARERASQPSRTRCGRAGAGEPGGPRAAAAARHLARRRGSGAARSTSSTSTSDLHVRC